MERTAREAIIRRLEFVRTELTDLEAFTGLEYSRYLSDRVIRRNIERMIENIINALTDIGKIILAQTDVEMPESYRGIFEKLGALGWLDAGLATRLAEATRLRNILAHQYLDIKWKHIEAFLAQGRCDALAFLERMEEWMAGQDGGAS
ncbi:MAG: type VII toxin-antitoxin system HepT family RNase toxin [Bacillota bacterium]